MNRRGEARSVFVHLCLAVTRKGCIRSNVMLPSAAMQGVSVYPRAGRPHYYISFECPLRLVRVHEVTPFRVDDPEGMRKANALAMEKAKEARITGDGARAERWEAWVLAFLEHQYRGSRLTLKRYKGAWKWLALFFIEHKGVLVPRAVTYHHGREFHQWRTGFKKASGRQVCGNTALDDIKAMQVILQEAVNRGFAPVNVWAKLNIKREARRHARELEPHELKLIEEKLPAFVTEDEKERAWMPIAYQIARYQGCRLRETRLNLRQHVRLRENQIIFHTKGRKDTEGDTTLLHPKLRPLFERLIEEKRTHTLDYGERPSILWRHFFDTIGLHDAWFHCLRSTVITELARAGVPISLAMRFVLHASEEIHRAYQRLKTGDLSSAAAAIGSVQPAAAPVPTPAAANLQAALIAELVRGGIAMEEAIRSVLHASARLQSAGTVDLTSIAVVVGADTPTSS